MSSIIPVPKEVIDIVAKVGFRLGENKRASATRQGLFNIYRNVMKDGKPNMNELTAAVAFANKLSASKRKAPRTFDSMQLQAQMCVAIRAIATFIKTNN